MCVGLHVRLTPARNIFMSQLFLNARGLLDHGALSFLTFWKIKKIANPIDAPSERGVGFRSGYMGEKLWCIAVLDNPWFHAQDTVPLSINCTYFQAETRRETWTKSHPKTSLLPALFLDSRNKSAYKQSVVYDKINPPNMRTEKRLFFCSTPLRFGKCWFSFVSEKIFTHLPPAATYILYFSVAANFND
jgi:hypothetical protein